MKDGQDHKDHFHGKSALEHIVEVQAEGLEASIEVHGAETPGVRFACLDAARETAVCFALLVLAFDFVAFSTWDLFVICLSWGIAWSFWKAVRATWISWTRLERLHRIAREEKHEIETNRTQEREELYALYSAKGFHGALLEQVIDVLMSDQERLLQVMLQEEMGFRLSENQHPLAMGLGAFLGSFAMVAIGCGGLFVLSPFVIMVAAVIISFGLGALYAYWERNNIFKAGCWSAMAAAVAFVVVQALLKIFM